MIRLFINLLAPVALLLLTSGCNGPLGPIPGGKLSGTDSDKTIRDWSFAADVNVIQLETRPGEPHSVNTWVGVYEGKLYIPTSLIRGDDEPDNRDWVKHVLAEPRVRLRVNGTIYPATASRVMDQELLDTVRKQLLLKYVEEPTETQQRRVVVCHGESQPVSTQRAPEEEILTWCGVIAQLSRTRAKKIIADAELPYPLFILLRHFCHDPERKWTVSQLTEAFETGQSGMTKRVQKLIDLGYLAAQADPQDARTKWIHVTSRGRGLRDQLLNTLAPDQTSFFADWKKSDVEALHRHLFKLKTYLDENRDNIVTRI